MRTARLATSSISLRVAGDSAEGGTAARAGSGAGGSSTAGDSGNAGEAGGPGGSDAKTPDALIDAALADGTLVVLDGSKGLLHRNPGEAEIAAARAERARRR